MFLDIQATHSVIFHSSFKTITAFPSQVVGRKRLVQLNYVYSSGGYANLVFIVSKQSRIVPSIDIISYLRFPPSAAEWRGAPTSHLSGVVIRNRRKITKAAPTPLVQPGTLGFSAISELQGRESEARGEVSRAERS
jgi:hypothetical protein